MYNIWNFLLQTISVSIVILILLVVKYILTDKLSPRWQYGVWVLLMLRILIPINVSSYIIPKFPIWLETIKAICEKRLNSNYTSVYEPIGLTHIIPIITNRPESITDWLFVIYILGIIINLLRYLISYISLRFILGLSSVSKQKSSVSGRDALKPDTMDLKLQYGTYDNSELELRILSLCEKYHLKPCQTVSVSGISSAFICGVLRPILVVPKDIYVDDKILLHELLHLKNLDTVQNIGWCILRSLHWCNPLVQYAIYRIENDMESLCDQRVLERLEGEERREYGAILLDMANTKYARVPGTSSISNGGKNISRRIAAIVRFKKYPQGMSLVSVCIVLLLFSPTIIGNASTYNKDDYLSSSIKDIEQTMAVARLNRCSTIAGALDTYAKGLMLNNAAYIASASSLDKHQELDERIYQTSIEYGYQRNYVDTGLYMNYVQEFEGYHIYNLKRITDTYYQGFIVFSVRVYTDESGENWFETPYDNKNRDESDVSISLNDALLIIPVEIKWEDAWVVEETGNRSTYNNGNNLDMEMDTSSPYIKKYYAEGKSGTITLTLRTRYSVDNTLQDGYSLMLFGNSQFDDSPKTDAVFDDYYSTALTIYDTTSSERKPATSVGIVKMELESENEVFTEQGPFWDGIYTTYLEDSSSFSGSSNNGDGWTFLNIDENWNGILRDGSGGSSNMDNKTGIITLPPAYAARIYWDNAVVEELTLKEVME